MVTLFIFEFEFDVWIRYLQRVFGTIKNAAVCFTFDDNLKRVGEIIRDGVGAWVHEQTSRMDIITVLC